MRKWVQSILAASLFTLIFNSQLYAQKGGIYYDHYTVNDGLPTQTIYTLIQDRKGFLWIATEAGVSCFDGKEFKNYTTEDGLGDNEVLDIYEDLKGRIWFIPFSARLSYYYKGKFHNATNDDLIKKLPLQTTYPTLVEDEVGNLYSLISNKSQSILKIDTNNKVSFISLPQLTGKNDSAYILYRSQDKKTVYCITRAEHLILFKSDGTHTVINLKTPIYGNNKRWFVNTKKPENIGYIDKNGVHLIIDLLDTIITKEETIAKTDGRLNLTVDKYKNIWQSHLSQNTLFYRYTDSGYTAPTHLLPSLFSIIAFDNENNVWFCTSNQGIYKLPYSKLVDDATFYINQQLLQKNVLSIHAAKDGTLWMGYSNGSVTMVSEQNVKHYDINFIGRTHNRVLQISSDKDGDVWCGGDETFVVFKKLSKGVYAPPQRLKIEKNVYYSMPTKGFAFDTSGRFLITSSTHQKWANKAKMTVEGVPYFNPYTRRLYSSFFDRDNNKYVSTLNGLLLVKNNKIINLSDYDPKLNTRIQHYAQDSKGTIFLATYSDGLLAVENNKVVAGINKHKGLAGTICRKVICHNDTLYIATNGGLTIATYNKQHFTIVLQMGQSNGLPSVDVNDISFLGNVLYVATSEGITAITLPIPKPTIVAPPQLTILSFTVNNTPYSTTSPIVFPYKKQRVSIEFIAPVMDKPSTVKYRYRLANTADWNIITTNQLEFNDLQYGKHTIELQAKKYNSNWGEIKKLSFTITPPYYSTWWFRALVVIAVILGLYSLVRYMLTKRFKRQLAELKQKEAIEKERNRIAADIHDDIGAELTNIVILSRILKEEKTAQKPYGNIVDTLEKSSNEVITKMNEVIWTLNASNDTLHNLAAYLRNYITTFLTEHNVEGNINIHDDVYTDLQIKAETSRNIFLIIKESLHNIVKHSQATKVSITLKLKSKLLLIEIHDNGIGFDTLQQYNGNGLRNIRKRVEALKGEVEIISEKGKGTTTKAQIPLSISA